MTASTVGLVERRVDDRVALRLQGIAKTYHSAGRTVHALVGLDLHVTRGEFISVIGASGCGK